MDLLEAPSSKHLSVLRLPHVVVAPGSGHVQVGPQREVPQAYQGQRGLGTHARPYKVGEGSVREPAGCEPPAGGECEEEGVVEMPVVGVLPQGHLRALPKVTEDEGEGGYGGGELQR